MWFGRLDEQKAMEMGFLKKLKYWNNRHEVSNKKQKY